VKPIRVLIVEDSPVVQEHLRRIISSDPRLTVAGIAASGEEALEKVEWLAPDVVSMDIHLPGIQGFEATRQIMARRPTPIVVVSSVGRHDVNLTMEALKAGALAAVEKPVAGTHEDYQALASRLCTQLAIMSEVKVVRQRNPGRLLRPAAESPVPARYAEKLFKIVGIAASTGGPAALMQVLNGLGRDFPLPVAIVQHMTPGFMEGFAEWLSDVSPFRVSIICERTFLAPGHVYLAPTGSHAVVSGTFISPDDGPSVGSHRPSANVLFSSMARSRGAEAIGVLLTGMGDDGASGLLNLRLAGGYTIAESESTAVVYGMPGVAVQLGAACESLPLGDIARRITDLTAARAEGN
jgi:two-component system, chemotaxis family, protein-glutamate methylesterase/glutaminase